MMDTIKRGATFRVAISFSSDAEWAVVYPYTTATASLVDSRGTSYPLTVTADAPARSLILTATAAAWAVGRAKYDVLVIKSGSRIPIPFGENVDISVIEGVTQ